MICSASILKWMRLYAVSILSLALVLCAHGRSLAGGHGGHGEAAEDDDIEIGAEFKTRGFELGEFRIRAYYPVEAQKSTVTFILFASVASDRYAEVKQLAEKHKHMLRDQIITATRMAPLTVFDEPDLASFRRRIFLRLRRALPELAINDVHVSEFHLTVKSL